MCTTFRSQLDPTELIARALKAKFANMRHELDSPESPDSPKRRPRGDENDNEFTPPPTPTFPTPMLRRVRDRGAEDVLRSGSTSDATISAALVCPHQNPLGTALIGAGLAVSVECSSFA